MFPDPKTPGICTCSVEPAVLPSGTMTIVS